MVFQCKIRKGIGKVFVCPCLLTHLVGCTAVQYFCTVVPAIGDTTLITTKGPKQPCVVESAFEAKKGTKAYMYD